MRKGKISNITSKSECDVRERRRFEKNRKKNIKEHEVSKMRIEPFRNGGTEMIDVWTLRNHVIIMENE